MTDPRSDAEARYDRREIERWINAWAKNNANPLVREVLLLSDSPDLAAFLAFKLDALRASAPPAITAETDYEPQPRCGGALKRGSANACGMCDDCEDEYRRGRESEAASAPRQEPPSPEAQGGITSEVDATGAAYYALASLEPAERRAALRWLTERTLADLRSVAAPPPRQETTREREAGCTCIISGDNRFEPTEWACPLHGGVAAPPPEETR